MTKKIYGYVRVSTKEQNPKRQIQNLKEYGIDERDIIIDTCTGTNFRRSGYSALEKVLLEEGDELVILSIDRLGRNKNATKREYNKLINKGLIKKIGTSNKVRYVLSNYKEDDASL